MNTGLLAATEVFQSATFSRSQEAGHSSLVVTMPTNNTPVIKEDELLDMEMNPPNTDSYNWRINLSKTEKYWKEWFNGLSQKFLNCSVPKMLLLANIHGLDTTLTVGQMQGK